MTKNRLLNVAITLCRITKMIFVLLFIGFTVIFIHLQIDRSFYSSKKISINTDSKNYISTTKWKANTNEDYNKIFTVDKLKTGSLYVMYLKLSLVLILLFLCIREFQKVIESVKGIKTFGENNVLSFRRIGRFILAYAILTSYTSMSFENGGFTGVYISFTSLFLVLFAFIMAEIFKEGFLIKQENDLTI